MHHPPVTFLSIEDAGLLATLHAACFAESWPLQDFSGLLLQSSVWGLNMRDAAFILCRSAADECEILTLAVGPGARRQGIGTALVTQAMREAKARDAAVMFLEVAVSNAAARALYHALGFENNGIRKGYYPAAHGAEDAVALRKPLR